METAEERLTRTALAAGMPADQLANFLSAGHVPLPWQCRFHAAARAADVAGGPDAIGCGGARGPGKSTAVFAQLLLDDARRVPGFKALYLRRALKQAREQFDDLLRKVLAYVPYQYNRQEGWVRVWEGSRIYLGHFHSEADIDNYLGLEYDAVAIEEATTLTASKRRAVRDSMRSSKEEWRPREYNSTNPGGVGHGWYKQTFIVPWREERETTTCFVPATVDDNPLIDGDYTRRLEENVGWRLRAYRYGDWEVAAGQFFLEWRYERHVSNFELEPSWTVWGALDYGHDHPMAFLLFATDGDGCVYVADEICQRGWLPEVQASEIKALLARHQVGRMPVIYAGHDVFAQKGQSPLTIDQQFAQAGVPLVRATIDRVAGATKLLQLIGSDRVKSRLRVHARCHRLIETLPLMQHDPARPEDVLKVDIDEDGNGGDDCFVAGTMISTIDGAIPVERIRVGDLVLTRSGYKPVVDIWLNNRGRVSDTVRVVFSNGNRLIGTPNHKVFLTDNRLVSLDSLRYGDIIQGVHENYFHKERQWQSQKRLSLMGLNSDVIQRLKTDLTNFITGLGEIIENVVLAHCIRRYGSRYMGRFLQDTIYTMLMGITSTMTSPILLQSPVMTTYPSMGEIQNVLNDSVNIWTTLDRWLPLGTSPKMDGVGIANMGGNPGLIANPSNGCANSVELHIKHLVLAMHDFVQTHANLSGVEQTDWILSKKFVSLAERPFCLTNMSLLEPAPVFVLGVQDAQKNKTYAIHVADQHEYYANGVLVQNCYDCLRYGAMAPQVLNAPPLKSQQPRDWSPAVVGAKPVVGVAKRMEELRKQAALARKMQGRQGAT